jgi:hypothetical protein
MAAPRLPLPQRRGKVQSPQAIPLDISTPRDMKSAASRGSLSTTPKPIHSETQQHRASTQDIPRHLKKEAVGNKRPISDDDHPGASTSTVSMMPKPQIPLVKRQKQGPNIFIPKSNKVNKID